MNAVKVLRDSMRVTSRVFDVTYEVSRGQYTVKIEVHGVRGVIDHDAAEIAIHHIVDNTAEIEGIATRTLAAFTNAFNAAAIPYHFAKCWVTREMNGSKCTVFTEKFSAEWD